MNWIQKLFKSKKVDEPINSAFNKHNVIGSVCPKCGLIGKKTTMTDNSYACKKCDWYWAN